MIGIILLQSWSVRAAQYDYVDQKRATFGT